jgi:hypothetical protein
MANPAATDFSPSVSGLAAINTFLTEEANRINNDVHRQMLHVGPWTDLIRQSPFPDGMGYQLSTLIYDRAVPTSDATGSTAGVTWTNLGTLNSSANAFNTNIVMGQPLKDAITDTMGPRGTGAAEKRSFINFSKQLKEYSIKKAVLESPRLSLEDLRFAVHRADQLSAIIDLMAESTRYTWENRYRDEYDRLCANVTFCLTTGTNVGVSIIDVSDAIKFEGVETEAVDLNNDFVTTGVDVDYTPSANISNKILDSLYFRNVRAGAGARAYGMENGKPVFGLVLSSEASYFLQTEAGFRDDVRYSGRVNELLAPLGVEKGFRGYYHLVDDLAPRFNVSGTSLERVMPYTVTLGVTTPNAAYETALYEAAFLLHQDVMESQIPAPFSGAAGVSFDAVNFRGDYRWTNIKDEITNPDGTTGFFRGIMASASKPLKTNYGHVIVFKRTVTTPAA